MDLSEQALKFIFQKHKMEYIKKLGSGGFGAVYLVNSIGQEFLPLAVKCITKKQLIKHPSLEKYLTQEINSMHSLKHANIVRLVQTFVEESSIFLVMEYCEFGNLFSYQYSFAEKVFKIDEACTIFLQILNGLEAIHHQNIIHRDIKCQNILLKKVPKQKTYICKIGDFGFAKELSETAKSHCGTPNFMAPQILAEKDYDKCVDVWSIGVILFYMLFGDYPFKGMNLLYDIESKCVEGYDLLRENNPQLIKKKNKSISEKQLLLLQDFFKSMFIINPSARITIPQIYKHPLFKNHQSLQNTPPSTESAELLEEQRISLFKRIQFVESIQILIKNIKILSPENQTVFKFMLLKVCLWIMNTYLKQSELNLDKQNKVSLSKKIEKTVEEYKKLKAQIQKVVTLKQPLGINVTLPQLNTSYEKFQHFKDIYRTFLGYVFSQIHSSPLKEKQRIKIKILCCHTINRVFEDPNSKYFHIFNAWAKSKLKQNKLKNCFDFDLFQKWIDDESSENISKTISAINDYFYTKK